MSQFQCEICGIKDALTFHCNYCGGYFCEDHHLPENHKCNSIPKMAPFHVRPPEVESHKPSYAPQPSYKPHDPSVISYPPTNQHYKTKPWKKIVGVFAILILAALLVWAAYPILQQSARNSSVPRTIPNATLALTMPYVEVDYQIVGWFYGTPGKSQSTANYNYTYLVLNVTITNHGYSQINIIGNNGFSVLINEKKYMPLISNYISFYNGSISDFYGMQSIYSFNSELPSQAILLDIGSVNGILIFEFGDPNVYPQQPQILNKSFALQYSVSYGDSVPLWERQV